MWDVPPTYSAALKWLRARAPVTKDEYDALTEEARAKAWTVSGVAQLDLVTQIHDSLEKAVANGVSFEAWQKVIGPSITAAWGGEVQDPGWRLQTIFRTNVQATYAAGRHDQMTDPDVLEERPYWRFDGVQDSRETAICRACNDTILPADDPWWKSHHPPLHFNCRSAIVTLSESEAEDAGVTAKKPAVKAETGFGATPETEPWTPDRADYPKDLWAEHEKKDEKAPEEAKKAKRARKPKAEETPRARVTRVLGEALQVHGEGPEVDNHLDNLARVPDKVLRKLAKAGVRIDVGVGGVPSFPGLEHLAGVRPRGYPEGRTWDDVDGAFLPGAKRVVAGTTSRKGSGTSTVLHETGHAIGQVMGHNDSSALIAAHKRLFNRLSPYFKQDGPGGLAGRQELFAEAIAHALTLDRAAFVATFDESFAKFIYDRVLG